MTRLQALLAAATPGVLRVCEGPAAVLDLHGVRCRTSAAAATVYTDDPRNESGVLLVGQCYYRHADALLHAALVNAAPALVELVRVSGELRDGWAEGGCLVSPSCGTCTWCRFTTALAKLGEVGR